MMYDKACNSRVQSQKICIVRIKFLSLRFKWFKCKVWDYILLDKTYLNECIESYFCFNFQENLFIIVGDNFHYKSRKKLVEKQHMKRECMKREIVK